MTPFPAPRGRSLRHLRPRAGARPGPPPALRLRLALARHRRAVAAALAALAVATGLQALRPARPPTTAVLVAARDLPAGHRLTAADLARRDWSRPDVPSGLLARPQGRVLLAPIRRGEPVTDVRVTHGAGSPTTRRVPAGWVSTTVRLSDPAATLLVVPGDRITVIQGAAVDGSAASVADADSRGGAGGPGTPRVLVDDALVLAAPPAAAAQAAGSPEGQAGGQSGGLFGALPGGSGGGAANSPAGSPGGQLPAGVLEVGVPADDAVRSGTSSRSRPQRRTR